VLVLSASVSETFANEGKVSKIELKAICDSNLLIGGATKLLFLLSQLFFRQQHKNFVVG
jgi:hypothetical protein